MTVANEGGGAERRVAPRLPVCWSGQVLIGPSKQTCMVRDLSPTGANLGHVGSLKRAQVVSLRVLHGQGELHMAARVMWTDEITHTAGVAFLGATPEAQDRLRQALGAALERLRGGGAGQVLIVGLSHEEADDVVQAARAFGLSATCATAPLDAIRLLLGPDAPVAVIVAPVLEGSPGGTFCDLVARERPEIARILICDGRTPARGTIPPDGRRLLHRPWDALALGEAIGAALHVH
jgi:hypothetical protein